MVDPDDFNPDDIEPREADERKRLSDLSASGQKAYTLCLAHAMFINSIPTKELLPAAEPQRCFILAEEFTAEALRRGY